MTKEQLETLIRNQLLASLNTRNITAIEAGEDLARAKRMIRVLQAGENLARLLPKKQAAIARKVALELV